MRKRSLAVVSVFVLVLALVGASLVLADQGVSFSTAPAGSAPSGPEPAAPTAGTISITHSASQQILSGNSVSCNDGIGHTDNAYLRRFTLADFGITGDFEVTDIEMAIEESNNSQPATINLYLWNPANPFTYANFTSIGSFPVTVPAGALYKQMYSITPTTVPAGSTLVVEFFTPSGQAVGNLIWVGSNNLGQTDDSFLAAAACGVAQPTATGTLGFPGMHVVKNVYGSEVLPEVPDIAIEKAPDFQQVTNNGIANFTITVTNTGNVTLTDVTVADALVADCDSAVGTMAPGDVSSYTCADLIGATNSYTNTAVVTSLYNGQTGPAATDTAYVEVVEPTGVALSEFGSGKGIDPSVLAIGALLVVVAGLGLVMRRKLSS